MNARTSPVLLCFDGSPDAEYAIRTAGDLLGPRPAVVLIVTEAVRPWAPSDPATILNVPIARVLSKALELEEIAEAVSREQVDRGVELAVAAGFDARARAARGKPWKVICDIANELDASVIVLGARGLSAVQSALLGSVSATVSTHARRPVLIIHPPAETHPTAGDGHAGDMAAREQDRR